MTVIILCLICPSIVATELVIINFTAGFLQAKVKIALQEQAVKKYALPERPEKPDDPEVLTPEQLHALKKLGYKNKNYVPVGRRGIYGGVIQNMHLHWKKHETVRVDCDNYKKDEVKEMAVELEKISGGKVIDIHQGTTIIMYRGKNYKQPKKLIPDNMLDKRKVRHVILYVLGLVCALMSHVLTLAAYNFAFAGLVEIIDRSVSQIFAGICSQTGS